MTEGMPIERTVGTSGANAAQTVSSPTTGRRVLKYVLVAYTANVGLDVTVTLNSGEDAAYDTLLSTLTFAAGRYGVYIPDHDFPLGDGDAIDVLAPAGGAAITSSITIGVEPE